jgi:COMPASS component SWD1
VTSWSRDGRKLLSASSDWTVKLWDVLSGNVDQTLQLESAALFCQIHPRDPYATLSACVRAWLFSNMLLRVSCVH